MAKLIRLILTYKTYSAAVGLLGLAVYQASQSHFDQAAQSIAAAVAAAGLRHELGA
jgi:hypothetical protein